MLYMGACFDKEWREVAALAVGILNLVQLPQLIGPASKYRSPPDATNQAITKHVIQGYVKVEVALFREHMYPVQSQTLRHDSLSFWERELKFKPLPDD